MENLVLGVVGLGYVGLPLAISFSNKLKVIGFDISEEKIKSLQYNNIEFITDENKLKECNVIIVAVPTPVDIYNIPDLHCIKNACTIIGRNMKINTFVIFESTVYPGLTEDICIPILEKYSGYKCINDFKVGYSPERINPGDKIHTFENVSKVVSGIDDQTLEFVYNLYSLVVKEKVIKAPSIKVAEAAKVIENSQRDINIAFVNELSIIFNKLNISTKEVLDIASSKWNFLKFKPGLVGGHCIGVDPYYLSYKAQEIGYYPEVILAGRRINDNMGKFIATSIVKKLLNKKYNLSSVKILVLGLTFKENVCDYRNSKVIDLIKELKEYNVKVFAEDPYVSVSVINKEYSINVLEKEEIKYDTIVLAVSHDVYKNIGIKDISKLLKKNSNVIFDIKGILNKEEIEKEGIEVWQL